MATKMTTVELTAEEVRAVRLACFVRREAYANHAGEMNTEATRMYAALNTAVAKLPQEAV